MKMSSHIIVRLDDDTTVGISQSPYGSMFAYLRPQVLEGTDTLSLWALSPEALHDFLTKLAHAIEAHVVGGAVRAFLPLIGGRA